MSLIPFGFWAASGAGGGVAAYDLLETTTLATSASSVTFSGLDTLAAGYAHLQIRAVIKTDRAGNLDNLIGRLNGDTGSNYSRHYLYGDGSSVGSASSTPVDRMYMGRLPGDRTADSFSPTIIDILDFSSSAKNTTLRTLNGNLDGTYATEIYFTGNAWFDTDPVTSIELYGNSSNLVSGSRFSLYGIKGA